MSDPDDGSTLSLATEDVDVVGELPEITRVAEDGRRIGRYELVYELGTGGMASVYLARARGPAGFHKWFAIKRIHPHLAKDKRFVRMFLDEARIAAAVQHPNVAQMFDLGEEGGEHYIAMEYLHGEHLGALIVRAVREWGRLSPQLAAYLVARAADGLHHAHEVTDPQGQPLGLVHRDVSPHNIFITYDGQVKITDFGVAKAGNRLTNTQTGTLKGKLAYLSPEQALGQEIDRRADIFSLGVVLWEITTGRRLFKAETDAQTIMRVTAGRVRRPSALVSGYPEGLERIVMRALATNRDKRYGSAAAVARDLDRYVASTGEPAGATELGSCMNQLFADRMVAKQEILRSEPGTEPGTVIPAAPRGADGSSGSGALPLEESSSKIVPKTESRSQPRPGNRRRKLLVAGATAMVVAAAAVGTAVLATSDTSVVRIDTNPPDALVVLDGRERGRTPVLLEEIPEGEHALRLERDGHQPRELTFEAGGDRINLMYDLGPAEPQDVAAQAGGEAAEPKQGGDETSADTAGQAESSAPSEEEAVARAADPPEGDPGTEPNETAAASKDPRQSGTVTAEEQRDIKRGSGRRPGFVTVITRPWSKVWINGRYAGTTPLAPHRVRSGVVTLRLQAEGKGDKKTVRLRVRPGETVPYSDEP